MSDFDFDKEATVAAAALYNLAKEWEKLPDDLQAQITRSGLDQVTAVIDNCLPDLGIEKEWDDSLHPADILDKYIFPMFMDRN